MPSVLTHATSKPAPITPLALWHLLSLDAPTVAALWTWFIARTGHVHVPAASIAAMFLAVWILYAADRLLDVRHNDDAPNLEARHLFHFRHRRFFRAGIILAASLLAPLLTALPAEAIRLYLIAGSLLFAWFVLIHIAPAHNSHRLPKELAVGAYFAAATFIPTVARAPMLRSILLAPALLFAALCSLNCLFIYAWEHRTPTHLTCHPSTRIALAHLPLLTGLLTLMALAAAALDRRASELLLAIAVSAALLFILDRTRPFSRTALRAAADIALLTPVFFLW